VHKGRGYQIRSVNKRKVKETFLIVCEGEKTEPNYFKSFRLPTTTVKQILAEGKGYNTISLVQAVVEMKKKNHYDHVWCVFDKDDFSVCDFNAALELAARNRIDVAYSNEAFELWYLLHYSYFNTGISRSDYIQKLDKFLEFKYEKNANYMYDVLKDKQYQAIQNAERLLGAYPIKDPAVNNPSTTVHRLVEALNEFIRT